VLSKQFKAALREVDLWRDWGSNTVIYEPITSASEEIIKAVYLSRGYLPASVLIHNGNGLKINYFRKAVFYVKPSNISGFYRDVTELNFYLFHDGLKTWLTEYFPERTDGTTTRTQDQVAKN